MFWDMWLRRIRMRKVESEKRELALLIIGYFMGPGTWMRLPPLERVSLTVLQGLAIPWEGEWPEGLDKDHAMAVLDYLLNYNGIVYLEKEQRYALIEFDITKAASPIQQGDGISQRDDAPVIAQLSRESWARRREQVKRRDSATCRYCGNHALDGQADHLQPLSKGGTDDLSNLVWACKQCNQAKGDKTLADWMQTR